MLGSPPSNCVVLQTKPLNRFRLVEIPTIDDHAVCQFLLDCLKVRATKLLPLRHDDERVGMGSDPRIGYHFIYPGAGYGGSCFPKDVQALARSANELGYDAELLDAVESVNYRQKKRLFEKLSGHYGGKLNGKTIAVWGLSFKPNTDDMREAPSRVLMEGLWEAGATVRAYDPEAVEEAARIYPEQAGLELCDTAYEALDGADALVIVTEWQEFRSPDFQAIKEKLADGVIVDGRNLYEPETVEGLGLKYYAIGRGRT